MILLFYSFALGKEGDAFEKAVVFFTKKQIVSIITQPHPHCVSGFFLQEAWLARGGFLETGIGEVEEMGWGGHMVV